MKVAIVTLLFLCTADCTRQNGRHIAPGRDASFGAERESGSVSPSPAPQGVSRRRSRLPTAEDCSTPLRIARVTVGGELNDCPRDDYPVSLVCGLVARLPQLARFRGTRPVGVRGYFDDVERAWQAGDLAMGTSGAVTHITGSGIHAYCVLSVATDEANGSTSVRLAGPLVYE